MSLDLPEREADRSAAALAFVSHEACARHDTGWNHPDHQGRLRAIVRAVYADLPVLHPHMIEVQGRAAAPEELARVHDADYLAAVQEASERAGKSPIPFDRAGGVMISGATWEAVLGASGSVITAAEAVIGGSAARAFACVRPAGRDALRAAAAGFSLVNHAAVAAAHLRQVHGLSVVIVDWGPGGTPGAASMLLDIQGITVRHVDPAEVEMPGGLAEALDELGDTPVDVVLLSSGFDVLHADPTSDMPYERGDIAAWTGMVAAYADRVCEGRLVSLLEGGYDAKATGEAVVAHLRALIGIDTGE